MKKMKYFGFPTYKRINSILNNGWKLTSVNSALCKEKTIVLTENKKVNSFSFEKSDKNYYCLQRFLYYTLWSEEEYLETMKEIEEYQRQGAYIISTWHIEKSDIIHDEFPKADVEAAVSKLVGDGRDLLYYIILPEERVKKQDIEKSYDNMLKFLGFDIYATINGDGIIDILALFYIGIFTLGHCFNIRSYYYFFRYRLYRKEYSVRYFLRKRKKKEREMILG